MSGTVLKTDITSKLMAHIAARFNGIGVDLNNFPEETDYWSRASEEIYETIKYGGEVELSCSEVTENQHSKYVIILRYMDFDAISASLEVIKRELGANKSTNKHPIEQTALHTPRVDGARLVLDFSKYDTIFNNSDGVTSSVLNYLENSDVASAKYAHMDHFITKLKYLLSEDQQEAFISTSLRALESAREVGNFSKNFSAICSILDRMRFDNIEEPTVKLPEQAPAKFIRRKGLKASKFLIDHYTPWLEAKVLFRPDLKRLDPVLKGALDDEFKRRTDEYARLLPTKSVEVDMRVESAVGGPVRPEKRRAVASALGQLAAAKGIK